MKHTLLIITFLLTAVTAQAGLLGPPQVIRDGQSPEAWVRTADMDHDGDGDVIYSPSAGRLEMLRRNADGTWTSVPVITSGVQRVLNAVVGDFNRDGLPDVAAYVQRTATQAGIMTVRQIAGNTFDTAGAGYVNAGVVAAAQAPLRLVDVDMDGRSDLVLAWQDGAAATNQGRVGWMRGISSSPYFDSPSALFLFLHAPCDVVAADFDRDGDVDIAVADNGFGHVRVCPGPTFAPAVILTMPVPPRHLELLDVNKDGWLDLMVAQAELGASPGNGLKVHRGSSSGFQSPMIADESFVDISSQSSLSVADLNLDGLTDAVLGSNSYGAAGLVRRAAGLPTREFTGSFSLPSGGMSCFDDDLDGDADLFLGTATGLVRVPNLTAHGRLTDTATVINSASGTTATGLAGYVTGDFNRDGREDVAVASGDGAAGNIRVFFNSGGTALTSVLVASNPFCRWLTAADFDADGDLDLAAPSFSTSRVVWYANNGAGSAWTAHVIPYAVNACVAISAGDLDVDGRPDIVTASPTGGVIHRLFNQGGGTWTGGPLVTLSNVTRLEIADVGPGGFPEVLAQHGSGGAVSLIRAIFGWTISAVLPALPGSGGEGLAAGDLNGDGLLDIVQGFGGNIYAAFQARNGTFGPSTYIGGNADFFGFTLPGTVRSVRIEDMDLDGVPECVGVFDRGIGIFSLDRPQRGHRPAVLLVKNSTELQGDAAIVRFNDDAVPDVIHHATTGTRLSVELCSAPVLTVNSVPAWTLAGSMNYPVDSNQPAALLRLTATSWAWAGDTPVRLAKLDGRFRRDNPALTPFDQATLTQFYTSFSLSEDAGLLGVVDDPPASGLTPGAPDSAGVVALTLGAPVTFNAGSQRSFYLTAGLGTLYAGWAFRVELESGRQDDWVNFPVSGLNVFYTEPAQASSTAARFVQASLTPRQSWRFSHWNTPVNMGAAADFADPDGDRMPNILEYALGQNPKIAGRPRLDPELHHPRFYVSTWCIPVQPDVDLSFYSSTDMSAWYVRATRQANGSWSAARPTDDVFPGNVQGNLGQQILNTPIAGKDYFRLEARELAP